MPNLIVGFVCLFVCFLMAYTTFCINTKWSRYWALPLVVGGVPMDPITQKMHCSRRNSLTKLGRPIYQDYSKTFILPKEILKNNVLMLMKRRRHDAFSR